MDVSTGEIEYIENKISPKHNNITLSYLISEKVITDKVRNLFENSLVKLKIDRRVTPDDMEFLLNKFKSLNPIELTVDYEGNSCEYDMDEEKHDFSGVDIQQAIIDFIDLMDVNDKKEITKYTIDLYQNCL
jgi:hypothetical protein